MSDKNYGLYIHLQQLNIGCDDNMQNRQKKLIVAV